VGEGVLLAADEELERIATPHCIGDLNDGSPGENSADGIATFSEVSFGERRWSFQSPVSFKVSVVSKAEVINSQQRPTNVISRYKVPSM
jgi:hypothetical protein